MLWSGGVSFGGGIAFIYADLLIVPILNIYRKYYGTKMMLVLLGTFSITMAGAGHLVEIIFSATNLIPEHREVMVMEQRITWNYTTWLNIAFVILTALLLIRFVRAKGIPALRMMGGSTDAERAGHDRHASWNLHQMTRRVIRRGAKL